MTTLAALLITQSTRTSNSARCNLGNRSESDSHRNALRTRASMFSWFIIAVGVFMFRAFKLQHAV
jgi:hypothetical protein